MINKYFYINCNLVHRFYGSVNQKSKKKTRKKSSPYFGSSKYGSPKSREPVNHGSPMTQAPKKCMHFKNAIKNTIFKCV